MVFYICKERYEFYWNLNYTHTVQIANIYAYDIHGNHISLRGIKECSDALKLREAKSNFAIIEVTKEVRHCLD